VEIKNKNIQFNKGPLTLSPLSLVVFTLFFLFFFFLVVLRFELRELQLIGRHSATSATPPALFVMVFFLDRVLRTICLGWLQTAVLLPPE
jgi:hypothetical protein